MEQIYQSSTFGPLIFHLKEAIEDICTFSLHLTNLVFILSGF